MANSNADPEQDGTKEAAEVSNASNGGATSTPPTDSPFVVEIAPPKDVAGFQESLGRFSPEELSELLAKMKSGTGE